MPSKLSVEIETKRCGKCHQTKPVEDFYRNSRATGGRQHYCKVCANKGRWERGRFRDDDHKESVLAANRKSYARNADKYRKQAGVRNAAYKLRGIEYLGGACIQCGVTHPAVLEFHHRDPTSKSFNISTALCAPQKYPWEIMIIELDKCDLLCKNCHGFHHSARFYEGFESTTWEVRKANERKEDYYGQKGRHA